MAAARLKAEGVDQRLDVLPGTRHALDVRVDAWAPTVAFLEKHLVASDGGRSQPVLPVVAAGIGAVAGGLIRRRRG